MNIREELLEYIRSNQPPPQTDAEITPKELAEAEGISKDAATKRLERMAESGILGRRRVISKVNNRPTIAYYKEEK